MNPSLVSLLFLVAVVAARRSPLFASLADDATIPERPAVSALSLKSIDGHKVFVDGQGRTRILHGTNAVVKGPPWVPDTSSFSTDISLVREDFVQMRKMGMTVLRLGTMWPGVETSPGSYNATYLGEIKKIIDLATEHGIYTILDMHQDVASEQFCGEGLPHFYVKEDESPCTLPFCGAIGGDLTGLFGTLCKRSTKLLLKPFLPPAANQAIDSICNVQAVENMPDTDAFPAPLHGTDAPNGFPSYTDPTYPEGASFPSRQDCGQVPPAGGDDWFMFQAAVACGSAYESLFNNVDNITDAWASMMGHLASTFKGVAGIVGIELINEPFVGNPYKSLRLMLPAHIADAALIGAEYGLAADLVSNLTALGEILANFTENNPNANADYINLQSAYDTVATSIHEADDERIVLFSPVTLANFGPGVTHPPGGEQYADTSVLAFHWYKPPQMGDGSFQASVFSHAAKELSVASILSETYAPANELGLDYFQTPGGVADSMDAATPPQGYVTWAYKPFCRESQETLTSTSQNGVWGACKTGYGLLWDEGSSLPPKINDQTRTYAPAIAGAVKLMKYDAATGEFELRFVIDGTIDAPTEIFASAEYTYPNDVSVTLDPPNVAQSARQGDYIIVWPLDGASGTELTVKVQHTTPQIKLAAQTNGAGHGGPYN